MDSEIAQELLPLVRVYKDGRVERLLGTDTVPAGVDPLTGVLSKDVTGVIPGNEEVYVRIYLPDIQNLEKLPLLVYFHGGGFCLSTPAAPLYHSYLNKLVAEARVVAVSVHYRRPPEHPLPTAYEDSWAALQWAVSHANGEGPEPWLNNHADFGRVFLSGESAGANIVHNLAMVAGNPGSGGLQGVDILGVALVHSYFWGSDPIGSEALDPDRRATVDRLWAFVCPSNPDNDDPRVNPVGDGAPSLSGLGCRRALVCVAEKDVMRDRGWMYFQELGRSGWTGVVEIHETEEEDHAFHLHNLDSERAACLIRRLAAFLNRDMPPPPI
ncbi:probable carboxylesterase 2 [Diospyros lotus]|uniref:probable carboxylesterase 2 n=1 Tax=Diospyros lotus TaxID=55363 RepID=UPI002259E817|nr:probable carboxylesterase 2 [Diospyros lotus]